jgi:hypothetical protein
VKSSLKSYLPGIDNADLKLSRLQVGKVRSGFQEPNSNKTPKVLSDRFVVTFRNPIQINKNKYFQIARVTMDKKGSVIKLAISR